MTSAWSCAAGTRTSWEPTRLPLPSSAASDLRPYQRAAVEAVLAARRAGKRRLLVHLPTGAGKTVIFSHLAQLARLELNETEIPVYQQSLSSILDFVGELNRADTKGVEPMAHPLAGLAQRLRDDVVTERDQHERYQANAPKVEAGLYLVPKVIE